MQLEATTTLAGEAIDLGLAHATIAAYALEAAGTIRDLDPELEAATVQHLLAMDERKIG